MLAGTSISRCVWLFRWAWITIALLLPSACGCGESQAAGPQESAPHAGTVNGSVFVQEHKPGDLVADESGLMVYLPGFQVSLRDKASGTVVSTRKTDVYGRYYLSRQQPGTYVLSWEAQNGWAAGRVAEDIVILRGDEHPDPVRIEPEKGNTAILGRTLLADASLPLVIDEYFERSETAQVSLEGGGGSVLHAPVASDFASGFALCVNSRAAVGAIVRARAGNASATAVLSPAAVPSYAYANVTLPNNQPKIVSVRARNASGSVVREVGLGETITGEVLALDTDRDALSVEWKGEYGPALTVLGDKARWTVPAKAGAYDLYALVSDARGGFARARLQISVGKQQEVFAGIAIDKETGARIQNAQVEVNGSAPQATNANGHFLVSVPLAKSYVVNVRHEGYAPACQTYDHGVQGAELRLVATQVEKVDAALGFTLVDRRDSLKKKKLRGAQLVVPAHALVDAAGKEPAGLISAAIATIDIGDDEAPGDWAAREPGGDSALISYGMTFVEFYDGPTKYQLKDKAVARIDLPLNRMQPGQVPAGAPAQIAIWSYDERDGYWKPSGTATLDVAQSLYQGDVGHLSYINMDQKGPATCIQVLIDPSLKGKVLRVKDAAGGLDYTTVKEETLDDLLDAVYRIPPEQAVQIDVLESAGGPARPDIVIERFDRSNAPAQGWVALPGNEVLAGKAIPELWPPYPYDDCPIAITIKWKATPDVPFLSFKGQGSAINAARYYGFVDNANNRGNLEEWFDRNGFDPDGSVVPDEEDDELYARTSFLNNNDLGSGRDMHLFRRSDGTVAAWVANYGNFDQNQTNADRAFNQLNYGKPVATVCMEFSPLEDASGNYVDSAGNSIAASDRNTILDESIVKFFVYTDRDGVPGTERQNAADLDGYGMKFVPDLCLNCHGGSVNLFDDSNPRLKGLLADAQCGAFFRELDYKTYKFPFASAVPLAPSAALPDAPDDKASFRIQNDIVRGPKASVFGGRISFPHGAHISSPAIKEIIDIWYRDGASDVDQDDCVNLVGTSTVDPESIPAGWADQPEEARKFYCEIVAQSCRTCHVALEDSLSWANYNGFKSREFGIKFRVKDAPPSRTMPHAIITYRNYWVSDPFRPDIFEAFSWPDPVLPGP